MRLSLFVLFIVLLIAPADMVAQNPATKKKYSRKEMKALDIGLESSSVFQKTFTGFALYDPQSEEMLYEYNADKYFIPASNTKIFTLYTSLNILGDSIPALLYSKQGDFLVIWGTGDPSFLNPKVQQNPAVFDFLSSRKEQILFNPSNFRDNRFGSGWMWGDFNYSYQAEKSPFPMYGNLASFRQDSTNTKIISSPGYFAKTLSIGPILNKGDLFGREEFDNLFLQNSTLPSSFSTALVPFRATPGTLANLLADTLKRGVQVLNTGLLPPANADVLYSVRADSLYKLMMQESDNFVAEQILLLCSGKQFGVMNTEQLIAYAKKQFLSDLPDEPLWVDGSGLSRYNLFTPRSLVKLLEKIQQIVPQDRLFEIFPAGGVSGTLRNDYRNGSQPYVFAKTGTLRHNHCLSGYLVTKKGRVLIFSFMHNNFTIRTAEIKREMERVLSKLREEL